MPNRQSTLFPALYFSVPCLMCLLGAAMVYAGQTGYVFWQSHGLFVLPDEDTYSLIAASLIVSSALLIAAFGFLQVALGSRARAFARR